MIDLTPLDVRNKRGDFKRLMRGYDPQEVDVFLEMVADRLEVLVRENLQLKERTQSLQEQVATQSEREQAVQDALVTAQELRADIRAQSQREAEHAVKEAQAEGRNLIARAEGEAKRIINEAEAESVERVRELERRIDLAGSTIQDLERRRVRFLKEFRSLLARELDVVEVEQEKLPFEERAIDLDLGVRRTTSRLQTGESEETRESEDSGENEAEARNAWAGAVEATEPAPEAEAAMPTPSDEDGPDPTPEADDRGIETSQGRREEAPAAAAPSVPPGPIGPPAVAPTGGRTSSQTGDDSPATARVPVPHPVLKVPRESGNEEGVDTVAAGGEPDAGPTIDVGELSPSGEHSGGRGTQETVDTSFADVPDLETLLAEAGADDAATGQDDAGSSSSSAEGRRDSFILFDFDEKRRAD
jgi:cell division initiation protein